MTVNPVGDHAVETSGVTGWNWMAGLAWILVSIMHFNNQQHNSVRCNWTPWWCGHFSLKYSQKTPQASPSWARHGVSFVSSKLELYSIFVIVISYVISYDNICYHEPCYIKIHLFWSEVCNVIVTLSWKKNRAPKLSNKYELDFMSHLATIVI